jgi:preprotein translocase subunit SecD
MRQIRALSRILMVATMAAALAPLLPAAYAQDSVQQTELRPTQITGLAVVHAKRTPAEGMQGIEITFDQPSGERLREFTKDAVGRRVVFSISQEKLATLRLLDPITGRGVLLTGDFDSAAVERLLSAGAAIDLKLE